MAALLVGRDGEPLDRNLGVVYPGGDRLQTISRQSLHVDPLTYPRLFPRDQLGYRPGVDRVPERATSARHQLTNLQLYAYRLAVRPEFDVLHSSGKLLLQLAVDASGGQPAAVPGPASGVVLCLDDAQTGEPPARRRCGASGGSAGHASGAGQPRGHGTGVPPAVPVYLYTCVSFRICTSRRSTFPPALATPVTAAGTRSSDGWCWLRRPCARVAPPPLLGSVKFHVCGMFLDLIYRGNFLLFHLYCNE